MPSSVKAQLDAMIDDLALRAKRFWAPREAEPDLSDSGFLVDPESRLAQVRGSSALPFEAIADKPVLILLGEPGIGKTTALEAEYTQIKSAASGTGSRVFWVDLGLYGSDELLTGGSCTRSVSERAKGRGNLNIFFDGFDECLQGIPTLAALLLEFLATLQPKELSIRIASRSADWPIEFEAGIRKHWGDDSVGVYQLAPLRRVDVCREAEHRGLSPVEFLAQVDQLGGGPLASRPITLRFLLDSFQGGGRLPSRSADLYQEGCRVLCDEWRERRRRVRRLSSGQRFAVASRLAAAVMFCGRTAIRTGPRHEPIPEEDIRADDLLGGAEFFRSEGIKVKPSAMNETLDTGLFRSVGRQRLGFSHRTYAEYLAAQYLADRKLPAAQILRFVLHEDGSDKVVPQLRGTAGWLASLVPEVCKAILTKDPESLLLAGDLMLSEEDRANLVRQVLQSFDSGELFDERVIRQVGAQLAGARLTHGALAADLRPYIRDRGKGIGVRRVAISIAELTRQTELQQDLLDVALSEDEPHEVRTIAVFALGRIGDDKSRASLKSLVTDTSVDDPDDELKGGALIATWPKDLTATELFSALSKRRKPNVYGLYQQFLRGDFVCHIQPRDMCIALDWAGRHVNSSPAEGNLLRTLGLSIVRTAVDFYQEPGVCEHIAGTLVAYARSSPACDEPIAAKLKSNPAARRLIASLAIRKAPDLWRTRGLATLGLILDEDIPFLLSELKTDACIDEQWKIVFLIRDILLTNPWTKLVGFDQVVAIAKTNSALSEMVQPVLGPIEWPSAESERLKAEYESEQLRRQKVPQPELSLQDKLLAALATGGDLVFESVCMCLLDGSPLLHSRDDELLPRWTSLEPQIQNRAAKAAAAYLKRKCPVDYLAWIRLGQMPYHVMFGFWALRLLGVKAPAAFNSIGAEVWRDWMPCVFGDPYSPSVVDARHEIVLKAAYRFAPHRFLEVLGAFIDGQNERWGTVYVLDRLAPVWDGVTARWLRNWLSKDGMKRRALEEILDVLIEAGDDLSVQIATDWVRSTSADEDFDVDRPLAAAFQLLSRDTVAAWQIVWGAVETNDHFATGLFAELARDPYSKTTLDLVRRLREDQLADMYIWVAKHSVAASKEITFGMITPEKALAWLGSVVIDNLAQRGTAEASRHVRRIKESLPGEPLAFLTRSTEELVRRNTWRPTSPSDLLSLRSEGVGEQEGATYQLLAWRCHQAWQVRG